MQGLKEKARQLWKVFLNADDISDFEDFQNMIDDNIVVIGSGDKELFRNKEEFINSLIQEVERKSAIRLEDKEFTCEELEVSPEVGLVYGIACFNGYSPEIEGAIDMDSRYAMLFRQIDGEWKLCHLHHSVPEKMQIEGETLTQTVTEGFAATKTQAEILENESIINEALHDALREYDADTSIEVFLARIGASVRGERMYIFEEKNNFCVNTYEWCAPGVTHEKENLQNVLKEDMQMWYDYFANGETVIIHDLEEYQKINPAIYEYLKPQNIRSLVVCPIRIREKIVGFYGIDNPPTGFFNSISNLLWTMEHFLVSMLQKREIMNELERMSYYDQLTGLRNRHALRRIASSDEVLKNTGIIYCDIMGLKTVNDTQGHEAGDDLIVRACGCLKNNFRIRDLYRIGGDEFLVLCPEISQDIFEQKIERLRKEMKEKDAMMALGSLWKMRISDLEIAISDADKEMYLDKKAYYKAKGKEK